MEAWHFINDDQTLAHHVKEKISTHCGTRIKVGQTLRVPGPPQPDKWGLHAAQWAANAVFYAPGLCACRVKMGGEIVTRQNGRELCATERTVLEMADARSVFWKWSCHCAQTTLKANSYRFDSEQKKILERAIMARWQHEHGTFPKFQFREQIGPMRALYRHFAGKDTRGRFRCNALPGVEVALLCLALLLDDHHTASRRPVGFTGTEHGQKEAILFERMLRNECFPQMEIT